MLPVLPRGAVFAWRTLRPSLQLRLRLRLRRPRLCEQRLRSSAMHRLIRRRPRRRRRRRRGGSCRRHGRRSQRRQEEGATEVRQRLRQRLRPSVFKVCGSRQMRKMSCQRKCLCCLMIRAR